MLKRILDFLGLFTSLGTLFCCALPALFVVLGLGSTFVSLLQIFPQLIWLSEHKVFVFSFAGIMLGINIILKLFSTTQSCPVGLDAELACSSAKKFSNIIFFISLALYMIGVFFAFVAPHLI